MEIGSWPFCRSRTNPRGHHTARSKRAQSFAPIVYFQSADGNIQMAGRDTDPTPRGCERRELRTIREYDRFCRTEESRLHAAAQLREHAEHEHFEAVKRAKRADADAKIGTRWPAEYVDTLRAARTYVDNKPRRHYQPAVFAEVFESDASNREAYREGGGWRPRK